MAMTARQREALADDAEAKRPARSSTLFFERLRELALIPGEERHLKAHLVTAERKYGIDLTVEKASLDQEISSR